MALYLSSKAMAEKSLLPISPSLGCGGGRRTNIIIARSNSVKNVGRRSLLSILLLGSTASIPEPESSKNLLQKYLQKSKENKARNDKERLEDYYKRNYKDYFEFIEGTVKEKKELSESEKGILEWLRTNK